MCVEGVAESQASLRRVNFVDTRDTKSIQFVVPLLHHLTELFLEPCLIVDEDCALDRMPLFFLLSFHQYRDSRSLSGHHPGVAIAP